MVSDDKGALMVSDDKGALMVSDDKRNLRHAVQGGLMACSKG